ncbi:MAG: MarR family transcriptional regulator [Thermoleophilaceae bacterium]
MQVVSVTPEQLGDELFAFLAHLHRTGQQDVFAVAAALELSMSQLRILFMLDRRREELALGAVAEAMRPLSIATVSRAVDGLTRAGFVTRTEDQDDRRAKRVAITAAGQEAIAQLDEARRAGLREFAASLGDEERTGLSAALAPILTEHVAAPCRAGDSG